MTPRPKLVGLSENPRIDLLLKQLVIKGQDSGT